MKIEHDLYLDSYNRKVMKHFHFNSDYFNGLFNITQDWEYFSSALPLRKTEQFDNASIAYIYRVLFHAPLVYDHLHVYDT